MFLPEAVVFVGALLLLVVLVRVLRVRTAAALRTGARDAALVAAGGGIVLLALLWQPAARAPLLEVDSRDLELTSVVPVTELPIPPGRNLLWCASFPLAWDAIRKDILGGAPLALGPPACREEVAALDANPFPVGDIDPACFVALGGTVRRGIEAKVREALRSRTAIALPPLGPDDAVAVAFIAKDLPFGTPFETIEGGLPFGEEGRAVRTFGLAKDSENPAMEDLLAQVRIHLAESDRDDGMARFRPDRFVVELLPKGGKDRILLAQVKPGPTLEATWEAVRAASAGPGKPAPRGLVLKVPKMNFAIDHRFTEFEGAAFAGGVLRLASQRTGLRLDETGARLRSFSGLHATLGIDPTFEFRRPFLVALVQKGATRPYLLLWVGNDELLTPE